MEVFFGTHTLEDMKFYNAEWLNKNQRLEFHGSENLSSSLKDTQKYIARNLTANALKKFLKDSFLRE